MQHLFFKRKQDRYDFKKHFIAKLKADQKVLKRKLVIALLSMQTIQAKLEDNKLRLFGSIH